MSDEFSDTLTGMTAHIINIFFVQLIRAIILCYNTKDLKSYVYTKKQKRYSRRNFASIVYNFDTCVKACTCRFCKICRHKYCIESR